MMSAVEGVGEDARPFMVLMGVRRTKGEPMGEGEGARELSAEEDWP
jgi:hypothetical protein